MRLTLGSNLVVGDLILLRPRKHKNRTMRTRGKDRGSTYEVVEIGARIKADKVIQVAEPRTYDRNNWRFLDLNGTYSKL
jgi:hypothetical protein